MQFDNFLFSCENFQGAPVDIVANCQVCISLIICLFQKTFFNMPLMSMGSSDWCPWRKSLMSRFVSLSNWSHPILYVIHCENLKFTWIYDLTPITVNCVIVPFCRLKSPSWAEAQCSCQGVDRQAFGDLQIFSRISNISNLPQVFQDRQL